MTKVQRIIKYFAYALAASIIVGISFSIVGVLSGISYIADNNESKNNSEMVSTNFENTDILSLDIELSDTNLTIKRGNYLKVDTNNTDIQIKQVDNKLIVEEKTYDLFWNFSKEDIIIYIPDNILFDNIAITAGVGKVLIEKLITDEITFKLGAGQSEISSLSVINKANIKCGTGKITIIDSTINNLTLDQGVGDINITAAIMGNNNIKTGVGSLNINLTNDKDNYKILTNKGIGEILIDGKDVGNDYIYGDGTNFIKIEGGIGKVDINFIK